MVRAQAPAAPRGEILYLFGIRGISSLFVMIFHLNYIVLATRHGHAGEALYHRLTDWLRYGDFRVSAFFVISGYLLMMPPAKTAAWILPRGVRGFLARRVERLVIPYYVALALSLVLFIAWTELIGVHQSVRALVIGTLAHVFMVHNLDPRTSLYINDTLWNVALEFQCYVIFAFALLPLLRRFGPWTQLGFATVIGLGPHFLFNGYLDWTRPWFLILYAMGVAVCAIGNPEHPEFRVIERRVPWGTLSVLATLATLVAIVTSPIDTPYGYGWLQNVLLGAAVSALLVYTRTGFRGRIAAIIRPVIHALENPRLGAIGRFSYSIYLIHYPILRLALALVARFTDSIATQAILGFFVFAPATVAIAYVFHVYVERPFANRRKKRPAVAAEPVTVSAPGPVPSGAPAYVSPS